jgi:hypothetical protein
MKSSDRLSLLLYKKRGQMVRWTGEEMETSISTIDNRNKVSAFGVSAL